MTQYCTAVTPVGALGTVGAMGVTAFDGLEGGPVPTLLVAVTVNVCGTPMSPRTVPEVVVDVAVSPPGEAVTVYFQIGSPPSEEGAVQETVASPTPAPAVAVTLVGALGAPGVTVAVGTGVAVGAGVGVGTDVGVGVGSGVAVGDCVGVGAGVGVGVGVGVAVGVPVAVGVGAGVGAGVGVGPGVAVPCGGGVTVIHVESVAQTSGLASLQTRTDTW